MVTLERILLQTIKFDLQVEHPYTYLLKYAKCLKGDQQKLQKMVQMAWNFVNDSLSTVLCLQWEPEIIAVALIYLASKLSKFTVSDWKGRQSNHTRWWDMFVQDMTMDILEDICHQVLDLYQNNPKELQESNSPPQKPPSRIESPSVSRISSGGNNHSSSSIGNYKSSTSSTSNSGGNINANNTNKPSTSANAAAIYNMENNTNSGNNSNSSGLIRKGGHASSSSGYPGSGKDVSNTSSREHFNQPHRPGLSSHSSHIYGATPAIAAGSSVGSHPISHLQSLYSQVTLPPPPPPPVGKYPHHPLSSSTARAMSPSAHASATPNITQPPLPPQPASSFAAPNYYNHPHYPNALPPIPMAPLPRLPPPPPPPPLKSVGPIANSTSIPSTPSCHHKQIPLPSGGFPSSNSSSSSSSSRQRY